MAFNGPMRQQERLSKEDIQTLGSMLTWYISEVASAKNNDKYKFLLQKLERMEKVFR